MSLNLPTINFNFKPESKKLIIITHGASEGIDSDFMMKTFNKVNKDENSVLIIQMPYKNRGESQSSGKDLIEELEATQKALDFVNFNQFESYHFIGKSLGGIIFSSYLNKQSIEIQQKSELTILGFIFGDVIIPQYINSINIIQGEFDKYGNIVQLQNLLGLSNVVKKTLSVIENADHSYRDVNKKPIFQEQAIEAII